MTGLRRANNVYTLICDEPKNGGRHWPARNTPGKACRPTAPGPLRLLTRLVNKLGLALGRSLPGAAPPSSCSTRCC